MALVERLPWYDQKVVEEREERTEAARIKAIKDRMVIEKVDERLEQLRHSAVRAGVRLSK